MTITMVSARFTLMPAVRAALGLAPTARNSNPMVERSSSHQTKASGPQGQQEPEVQPVLAAQDLGQMRAVAATGGLSGSSRPGRWKASLVSRYCSK